MGYSMRLELTLVSSINDHWSVKLVTQGSLFLFPGVCLLWFALPGFDILYVYSCVCVCVCVGVGVVFGFTNGFFVSVSWGDLWF